MPQKRKVIEPGRTDDESLLVWNPPKEKKRQRDRGPAVWGGDGRTCQKSVMMSRIESGKGEIYRGGCISNASKG